MARLNIPSVWIEQRITIFSYFRIQLDFDLRLRKVINVVLNSGSVMAFCAKNFPPWISRQPRDYQKSQKPTCDLLLLLSKPRGLPIGAFFQSRNSGETVTCRDKWSKRTDSILAEYYLRIQYIRPLGPGNTPGLHLSTSVDLHFHLFPHPMYHQQSPGSSGHPFQNGESANSHNIHKLLHLTSWNPRFHHKRIFLLLFLVRPCPFSSFYRAITRHAIN